MHRNQCRAGLYLLFVMAGTGCRGGKGDPVNMDNEGGAVVVSDCPQLAALPLDSVSKLPGFSGSEDFAFDGEGNLVSNRDGNITRQQKDGEEMLLSPNVLRTSGMAFLPNGNLIVASVEDYSLLQIQPDGTLDTLLTDFDYPNGVTVDLDGFAYVTEQSGGRITRVDPSDGSKTTIASGLIEPNGLSFSPDYRTLYVNSFGEGTVHKISVNDEGVWTEPELLGQVPIDLAGCEYKDVGDLCTLNYTPGVCVLEPGSDSPLCSLESNRYNTFAATACVGLQTDSPCTMTVGNYSFAGVCRPSDGVNDSSSPPSTICVPEENPVTTACTGKAPFSPCIALDSFDGVYEGTCEVGECYSDALLEPGGLDGLTVDACGNVYVTEYELGNIWRFTPDGTRDLVVKLPAYWIPNLHWGTGTGGWSESILYVMDREDQGLFELDLGIGEKKRAYP